MQRTEIPNNTPAQVLEYIDHALAVVEEVAPPNDLREAVFTGALNLIAGKQVVLEQPQPVDLSHILANGRGR